jgi:hypothetical protein
MNTGNILINMMTYMKRIYGLLFCLLMGKFLSAQNLNPREIIPLDSAWQFWLGDDQAARQPEFDDK